MGLIQAIEKLNPCPTIAGLVRCQLRAYKLEEGLFGTQSTKYDRSISDPAVWWEFYGSGAPELQTFAIRILRLSSASACERNWSSFDHIHFKKRNRLLSGRLEDLVYVRSNLQLALKNVAKESTNSSTPWIDHVPNALRDEADFYIDSDIDRELSDESDVEASSRFTTPTALDDIELFDITSGPREHQEQNLCSRFRLLIYFLHEQLSKTAKLLQTLKLIYFEYFFIRLFFNI